MTRPSWSSPSVLLVALLVGVVVLAPSAATSASAEVDDHQSAADTTPVVAPVHRRCVGGGPLPPQARRVRRWDQASSRWLADDHRPCDDRFPSSDDPSDEPADPDPDLDDGDGDDEPGADQHDFGEELLPPEAPEARDEPGAPEEPEAPDAPDAPVTPEPPDGNDQPGLDEVVPPGAEDDGPVSPSYAVVPDEPAAGTVPEATVGTDEVALRPSVPILGLDDGGPVGGAGSGSQPVTAPDDVLASGVGDPGPGIGLQAVLASARHRGALPVAGVGLVAVLLVAIGALDRRGPRGATAVRPAGRRRRFDAEDQAS